MDNGKKSAFAVHMGGSVVIPGATKRELFAAMAMQGFCAMEGTINDFDEFAHAAVQCADALLKALGE